MEDYRVENTDDSITTRCLVGARNLLQNYSTTIPFNIWNVEFRTWSFHSYLNASIGSRFEAFHAG